MTTALDDMFGGFDDDLDPNAGLNTRPDLGRGLYVLSRFYPKKTTKQGNIVVAECLVVTPPAGGSKKPGEMVSIAWMVSKVGIAGRYEKARAAGFVRALLGIPEKGADGKPTNVGPQSMKLCHETQPGTGILIVINGEANGEYRNFRYENVPGQTADKIKAMRDKVVSAMNYNPNTNTQAAAPAPAPAPTPAPAPAASASPLDALFGANGGFGGNDIPF